MAKDLFAEGIRLWLQGERQAAADMFSTMCTGAAAAETAAGKGMALWCQSQRDEALGVVQNLSAAVDRGFIDLNYMPPLGIAAECISNARELTTLQRICLKQLAVDALHLAGELAGPIKTLIQTVDNEVIGYRLACAEHNLLKLRSKYPQDYRKYQQMHLELLDMRRGRVEASVALVDRLMFQAPAVDARQQATGGTNN